MAKAKKGKSKKSGWVGGSFKAAVGGYLKKKVKKTGKSLRKGLKQAIGW